MNKILLQQIEYLLWQIEFGKFENREGHRFSLRVLEGINKQETKRQQNKKRG